MKNLFFLLCAAPLASAFGQGQIRFETDLRPQVDAPVLLPSSSHGPGPEISAQLFILSEGRLLPLNPATTFRAAGPGADAIADRYVNPVDVTVTNLPPGSAVTLVVRAWRTSAGSYESAQGNCDRGESAPFTITLGGGDLPAAPLSGLQSFVLGNLGCFSPRPLITAIGLTNGHVIITGDQTTENTRLQASSNLLTWNDLNLTGTLISFQTRTFTVDSQTAYEYYRLVDP